MEAPFMKTCKCCPCCPCCRGDINACFHCQKAKGPGPTEAIYSQMNTNENTSGKIDLPKYIYALRNKNFKPVDLITDHDIKNNISCPRCRFKLKHTHKMRKIVPLTSKADIAGVCEHCLMKLSRELHISDERSHTLKKFANVLNELNEIRLLSKPEISYLDLEQSYSPKDTESYKIPPPVSPRKWHSEESLIASFTDITKEDLKKDLNYFFPKRHVKKEKEYTISSSELIKDTMDRLRADKKKKRGYDELEAEDEKIGHRKHKDQMNKFFVDGEPEDEIRALKRRFHSDEHLEYSNDSVTGKKYKKDKTKELRKIKDGRLDDLLSESFLDKNLKGKAGKEQEDERSQYSIESETEAGESRYMKRKGKLEGEYLDCDTDLKREKKITKDKIDKTDMDTKYKGSIRDKKMKSDFDRDEDYDIDPKTSQQAEKRLLKRDKQTARYPLSDTEGRDKITESGSALMTKTEGKKIKEKREYDSKIKKIGTKGETKYKETDEKYDVDQRTTGQKHGIGKSDVAKKSIDMTLLDAEKNLQKVGIGKLDASDIPKILKNIPSNDAEKSVDKYGEQQSKTGKKKGPDKLDTSDISKKSKDRPIAADKATDKYTYPKSETGEREENGKSDIKDITKKYKVIKPTDAERAIDKYDDQKYKTGQKLGTGKLDASDIPKKSKDITSKAAEKSIDKYGDQKSKTSEKEGVGKLDISDIGKKSKDRSIAADKATDKYGYQKSEAGERAGKGKSDTSDTTKKYKDIKPTDVEKAIDKYGDQKYRTGQKLGTGKLDASDIPKKSKDITSKAAEKSIDKYGDQKSKTSEKEGAGKLDISDIAKQSKDKPIAADKATDKYTYPKSEAGEKERKGKSDTSDTTKKYKDIKPKDAEKSIDKYDGQKYKTGQKLGTGKLDASDMPKKSEDITSKDAEKSIDKYGEQKSKTGEKVGAGKLDTRDIAKKSKDKPVAADEATDKYGYQKSEAGERKVKGKSDTSDTTKKYKDIKPKDAEKAIDKYDGQKYMTGQKLGTGKLDASDMPKKSEDITSKDAEKSIDKYGEQKSKTGEKVGAGKLDTRDIAKKSKDKPVAADEATDKYGYQKSEAGEREVKGKSDGSDLTKKSKDKYDDQKYRTGQKEGVGKSDKEGKSGTSDTTKKTKDTKPADAEKSIDKYSEPKYKTAPKEGVGKSDISDITKKSKDMKSMDAEKKPITDQSYDRGRETRKTVKSDKIETSKAGKNSKDIDKYLDYIIDSKPGKNDQTQEHFKDDILDGVKQVTKGKKPANDKTGKDIETTEIEKKHKQLQTGKQPLNQIQLEMIKDAKKNITESKKTGHMPQEGNVTKETTKKAKSLPLDYKLKKKEKDIAVDKTAMLRNTENQKHDDKKFKDSTGPMTTKKTKSLPLDDDKVDKKGKGKETAEGKHATLTLQDDKTDKKYKGQTRTEKPDKSDADTIKSKKAKSPPLRDMAVIKAKEKEIAMDKTPRVTSRDRGDDKTETRKNKEQPKMKGPIKTKQDNGDSLEDKTEKKGKEKDNEFTVHPKDVKTRKADNAILNLVKLKKKEHPKPATMVFIELDEILEKFKPQEAKKIVSPPETVSELNFVDDYIPKKTSEIVFKTKICKTKDIPRRLTSTKELPIVVTDFEDELHGETTNIITSTDNVHGDGSGVGHGHGVMRYALSDRSFIDKGITKLPSMKTVRKMNLYRMRPAHPEFDWFKHHKHKGELKYDTGEKLADFDENGRGRWYYRNGRVALDYYDAEELNVQQRFVIFSNGEPDEKCRPHPVSVLGLFDYLGSGVVFDHSGKIRIKYNQSEGVVLDKEIGPYSHWKWHSLNDPPMLQKLMIDTQITHKDPVISAIQDKDSIEKPKDDEDMVAIEYENFIKEQSKKKGTSNFQTFEIRLKAFKINQQFSLRILNQSSIHLMFKDGSANLKLNLGMILDHQEIVDTDVADLGVAPDVSVEVLPAKTDSLNQLQVSIENQKRFERARSERETRIQNPVPKLSADLITAAASRPLQKREPLISDCFRRTPSKTSSYYSTTACID